MKNKEPTLSETLFNTIPIVVYRGCIVEKLIGGYRVLGKTVSTSDEVDAIINNSLSSLENSINK